MYHAQRSRKSLLFQSTSVRWLCSENRHPFVSAEWVQKCILKPETYHLQKAKPVVQTNIAEKDTCLLVLQIPWNGSCWGVVDPLPVVTLLFLFRLFVGFVRQTDDSSQTRFGPSFCLCPIHYFFGPRGLNSLLHHNQHTVASSNSRAGRSLQLEILDILLHYGWLHSSPNTGHTP